MEGPAAVLNVITMPPGATKTQARLVLDGVRGAIFLYRNGGPVGALIGSWAMSADTDPYGNAYPQGLNISVGSISAATIIGSVIESTSLAPGVKIDANGDIIVFNSHGAIIEYVSPAKDGTFVYADTGSATQGALIASVAGTSGTDPVNGSTYDTGVNAYQVIAGVTYAIGLNMLSSAGSPGMSVQDITNQPTFPAGAFGEASSASGALKANAFITSGEATAADTPASVTLHSNQDVGTANGLISLLAGLMTMGLSNTLKVDDNHGTLILGNPQGVAPANPGNTAVYSDNNDNLNYIDGLDGNNYHTGHNEHSGVGQVINTTAYTVLTGSQVNVAAKSYLVEWDIFVTENQSAGTPNYQFSLGGGAVASFAMGWFEYIPNANALVASGTLTDPTTISNGFQPPVMNSNPVHVKMKLFITFSTGGNVRIAAKTSAVADTFTITGIFTRLEPRQ